MRKRESGLTIVEVVIVIALFMILFSMTVINFSTLPGRATLQTEEVSVINELKNQQTQAMSGDTLGSSVSDYGIYFDATSYTLFQGSTYIVGAPGNFTIELANANLNFSSVTFPGRTIVFKKGSGEISDYTLGQDQVVITDSLSGTTRTIRLNKYGATY